jgi:hypothetical protein
MKKAWPLALATFALVLAGVVGYLTFGRRPAPSTAPIPAGSGAVATQDGAEVAPPQQP